MVFLPHTSDLLVKMTQRIRFLVYGKDSHNADRKFVVCREKTPTVTCGQYILNTSVI